MKSFVMKAVSSAAAFILTVGLYTPARAENSSENSGDDPVVSAASFDMSDPASLYSVLYDSSNGLPTSDANAVIQTSDGFIWVGSYSGLIRYDGNEFYRYDSSYGIPSVISLFEDSKKRLWIGTNDSGAACMNGTEFTIYDNIEGLKSASIRDFEEDSSGNIIIATKMGMAYVGTDDVMHVIDDQQLNIEDIRELKNDGTGVIFGHTNTGSFFTFEDMHVTSFYNGPALGFGHINAVCPVPSEKGKVYLGTTENEIICGDLADGMKNCTVTDVSPLVNINEISDIGGTLWICADNGVGYIDGSGVFRTLDNIPMNNSVDDVICDYEGNLWFTSSRQGIMKISPSDFTDINKAAGLPEFVVNSTCVNGGDLYIGTDSGLYILDEKTLRQKENDLTEFLSSSRIRCIKNDSKGNIWFCTYNGLICRKKDGSIVTFDEDDGLGTNKTRVSEELSDGRIVVSTNNGVFFIKDFEIAGHVSSDNGLTNAEILTICEGDNGQILLGSNGSGLYIVDGNNVTRIPRTPGNAEGSGGIRSDVILRIKKNPHNDVYWIITSSSISYMKDGEINTVTEFPYSNNFDIFFDEDGGAWILSSNGVYVTTERKLISNEMDFLFYDTSCGLPSVATANSRSFMTENEDIYIAGSKGVSRINMSSIQNSSSDIRLAVPFVEIDGKLYGAVNDTITIPPDATRITVYGYALTYSLKNPLVSCMLAGVDKEPSVMLRSNMKPSTYTNLAGGVYTYKLSVINPITGADIQTEYLTITKQKSLIEQYWFQLLMIVAGGIAVFLLFEFIHRKRELALIREQEKKQLLIDEMTQAFAKCVDMKDKYTNGHSFRVAEYSKLLAEKCGMNEKEIAQLYNVALLHDIGKISIPDNVLNKPGRPTDEEYEILKSHTTNGYEVLKDITIAPELSFGAGYHHERLDGKGYPNGLKGDEIPFVAQIIAVADTFDAMYSTRPYRKQMDVKDVLAELKRVSGTQLNGEIVDHLVELVDEGKIGQREL